MENKIYYAWLKYYNSSKSDQQLIEQMSDEEKSIAFNENPISFGTAGYRAKVGYGNHYLNEKTYKQLAIGYARYLKKINKNKKKLKVLVVHDNRRNASFFTNVVASALFENGITPVLMENNELLPTPIASYLIKRMRLDGGINVTASHNPKEYNGFKCYDKTGCQILPDAANQIIELLPTWNEALNEKINLNFKAKFVKKFFIKNYFLKVFLSLPQKRIFKRDIQLVYSSMHGTASFYMSEFLNKLGYTCIDVPSQNFPDSEFTNAENCNPEDPASLEQAIILAETLNIRIVLASDPDADRLAIAIKKGDNWQFINGNQAGIIETYYKLNHFQKILKTPVVISTYISNNLIDRIGFEKNTKIIRTPTGFKWIGAEINKLKSNEYYINGFEEAIGALPSPINRDKDSFQTAALILEIISFYLKKSMDLIDVLEKEIFVKYGHWFGETVSVKILGYDWKEKAKKIFQKLKNNNVTIINKRKITSKVYNEAGQCIEYYFDKESWVKFRISGTEPKFKIYTNLYPLDDKKEFNLKYTEELKQESAEISKFIKKYLGL